MKKLLLGTVLALAVVLGSVASTDVQEQAGDVTTSYYDPGAGDDE